MLRNVTTSRVKRLLYMTVARLVLKSYDGTKSRVTILCYMTVRRLVLNTMLHDGTTYC